MKSNFVFHLEIKVLLSVGRLKRQKSQAAWCPVWNSHNDKLQSMLICLSSCFPLLTMMIMLKKFPHRTRHRPALPNIPKPGLCKKSTDQVLIIYTVKYMEIYFNSNNYCIIHHSVAVNLCVRFTYWILNNFSVKSYWDHVFYFSPFWIRENPQ